VAGARVLFPRAEVAREVLPERLRDAGATLDLVTAYRTVAAPDEQFATIRARLEAGEVHVVTFTSSSTVERLVQGLGEGAAALLSRTQVAAISPLTADTCQRLGVAVHVVAREHTAAGLVDALVAAAAR
jgi:uroporphyrinogen III methyltransferase/synthase